jgi:hypothetical protein
MARKRKLLPLRQLKLLLHERSFSDLMNGRFLNGERPFCFGVLKSRAFSRKDREVKPQRTLRRDLDTLRVLRGFSLAFFAVKRFSFALLRADWRFPPAQFSGQMRFRDPQSGGNGCGPSDGY